MNRTSWLVTDAIQFLFVVLMHNQKSEKPYFHVVHPNVTQTTIASLYPNMVKVDGGTATKQEHDQCIADLDKLRHYIDTRLDIFERNFWFLFAMYPICTGCWL
jgi:hypothetical protein